MADTSPLKKPKWPQLPDGTTDWDKVFDDPENGLIHAVSQATSAEALRAVTVLIIQKLFTRENDKPEVEAFIANLDDIVDKVNDETELAATIENVAGLLTKIKMERQERAREYLRKKQLKKKGDRRAKRKKKASPVAAILKSLMVLTQPKVLIPLGIVAVISVMGIVLFVVAPMFQGDDTITSPAGVEGKSDTAKAGAEGDVSEAESAPKSSLWPRPVIMRPSQWPIIKAGAENPVRYASLLYVNNAKAVSAICMAYPRVKESLLVAFSSAKLGNRQPTPDELKRIAVTAEKLINKSIGNVVDGILIVPYGDPRFMATNTPPCRLAR